MEMNKIRSPILVPKELELFAARFDEKLKNKEFFCRTTLQRESLVRGAFSRVRSVAKLLLEQSELSFEPTKEAVVATKRATRDFYKLAFCHLSASALFPLAGLNKCLGVVVVPRTKLVLLAISEDRDPRKDLSLRNDLLDLINKVNYSTKEWVYELVCLPNASEYFILRTLSMKEPHEAPLESIVPRTRCVEVALMVALCKVGRFKSFNPEEACVMGFGALLRSSKTGNETLPFFGEANRNTKHTKQAPLEVPLDNEAFGYLDVWEGCFQHCTIYRKEMIAIGASGGAGTSFLDPRGECKLPKSTKKLSDHA